MAVKEKAPELVTPNEGESKAALYYRLVTDLIGEGMKPTQAFVKVAEQTGSQAGTVSTGYYRTARASGAPQNQRQGGLRRRRTAQASSPARTRMHVPESMAGTVQELEQAMRERSMIDQRISGLVATVLDWHVQAQAGLDQERAAIAEQASKANQLRDLLASMS